jgi:segregation and condensation protein A
MIEYVRQRLMLEDRPVRLRQLLRNVHTRQGLVCIFLALLEMIRLQAVLARQETVFGDIVLKKHTNFDQVLGESSEVRDDWK